MAEEILGRPIPNVALVAAFMGALNIFQSMVWKKL